MIFSGLDLGAAKDSTALVCADRVPLETPTPRRRWRYEVRGLKAWQLGTKYTQIAADLQSLYQTPQLAGSVLVPDYTGVGRPVVDTLRSERVRARIVPVLTTSGSIPHEDSDSGGWNVPKRDLVATLQVLLQHGLIVVERSLPLAERLRKEMAEFRVTISKARNETYGAAASQHDDIVFALMLAVWMGEHDGGGIAAGISVDEGSVVDRAPREVFEAVSGLAGNDPRRHGG